MRTSLRLLVLAVLAGWLVGCGQSPQTPTAPPQPPAAQARALFDQANSLYQQGRYEEAEATFRQASELDPTNPDIFANLGVTLYTLQRLDEAITTFHAALRLAPNDASIHYLLGAALLQANRLDEAEQSFLRANQLDPRLGEPYFGLGVLYRLRGDRERAITAFEKFLEIGPSPNGDPNAIPAAQEELKALRSGQ
ncbi:MAG: tetratricopeptide repeat protein [Caldilineales bacterium]|nr:tetratricopeptide repeat protein [Caldilineales bacterium]MDW8318725.1 tetratricopeptide repeat protein [Anaerolineae bacterium]